MIIHPPENPYIGCGVKIYDIETLTNCIIIMDVDRETDDINCFVIHESRNDLLHLYPYHLKLKGQVGFNSLDFDSQIIHFILSHIDVLSSLTAEECAAKIYEYAQKLIANQENIWMKEYNDYNYIIPQLDLLKIHHFDNVAKRQSLKGLQCNLNWPNVQSMPIDHKERITKEQIQIIINYCINDILSTRAFLRHKDSDDAIKLRKYLKSIYGIKCTNWSNSKIGAELCLKFYCEQTGRKAKEVRSQRTWRNEIYLKDCLPKYIKFSTPEFQAIYDKFEKTTVYAENAFKFGNQESNVKATSGKKNKIVAYYKDIYLDYGIGGLHSSRIGVFESDENYEIDDIDVSGMYPNVAIVNGFYPEHLGPEFSQTYRDKIVEPRLKEKALGDVGNKYIISGLKEAGNSVYGKSNDKHSFLMDPYYTLSTTVTGQIVLTYLIELLGENIKDCEFVSANTDGITIKIHKKHISTFKEICNNWEKLTGLQLEYVKYKKIAVRDVNNYIAIYENEKKPPKLKGCFEKDKPLHKDPSFRIIPLALELYFWKGISIEKTIVEHPVIWDFLGRQKFKKGSHGLLRYIDKNEIKEDNIGTDDIGQKVMRYFISNKGKRFIKKYTQIKGKAKNQENILEKGYLVTEANVIENEDAKVYDIDYKYYIKETQKIIDAVERPNNQLSLGF